MRINASRAPTQRRLPCPAALLDLLRLSVERFALLLAGAFLDLGSGRAYSLPEELALYLGCNRDHQTPAHFVKGSRFIKKTKVPLFSHLFIFCALDYPKKNQNPPIRASWENGILGLDRSSPKCAFWPFLGEFLDFENLWDLGQNK